MLVVGKTDAFERLYMEKFRAFASQFGEFVKYEHDRGARDIGLHLTRKLKSGQERLSTALCWFQMKGIMASTLSAKQFEKKKGEITISLEVGHLRYWYLQPMPTYLVVYIESVDMFLVMNVQDYTVKRWGKKILTLNQKTVAVSIPKDSLLDEQAFNLILTKSDVEEWKKVLGTNEKDVTICVRDYDLIWHLGTAAARKVEHKVVFMDWQSKTRSQFYIQERPHHGKEECHTLREHWQYMMNVFDLEGAYPYIEFYSLEDDSEDSWFTEDDEESEVPPVTLSNGDVVCGQNASYEYFEYQMGMRLNDIGEEMFQWVRNLAEVGLVEITPGKSEMISVAPWHSRAI